jgi:hypothetical protein
LKGTHYTFTYLGDQLRVLSASSTYSKSS